MHALKTTCVGQIFALAKPHDSVGKRTRNRIPKEERKILVESFIKKHQKLNNGSFPSLSLTHKEVGGSFYTIREIVREIIQENRVLGPGDLILQGKEDSDHLQDQSLSSSIVMDPVPPLSLSPNGFHSTSEQSYNFSFEAEEIKSPEKGKNINGSQASLDDRGSDILNREEVNGNQVLKEDAGLRVNQSVDSTEISKTQFVSSGSDENDAKHDAALHNRVQTVCDSVATKPQEEELIADNNDRGFEDIPVIESDGAKPVNSDERVNDDGAAMNEMVKNTFGTIDMPAEPVAETFPSRSVTLMMDPPDAQPSELDKLSEGEKGIEIEVEAVSSTINHVDLGELSLSNSAVLEEKETEVIVGQMPNHISDPMEKKAGEKIVNPASVDVECGDTKGTVVVNAVIANNHETKEFSNGTLTTEQKMPTSGTELGSRKNDRAKVDSMSGHVGNEVASVEKKATMEKKLDASDSSSSQKENNATLNRIKPESWKGESNMGRQETNPLLAVLKSFLTAFVKFWSE